MTTHDLNVPVDPELDRRLRRTLTAVAGTITESSMPATATAPPAPAPARRAGRWTTRRRVAIGLAVAAVPLAAFGYALAPEFVDRIPPKHAFISGAGAGDRYWVVPSFHEDMCDRPMPGVELVVESDNKVGGEWGTAGVAYGDTKAKGGDQASGCFELDESAWLRDPSRTATLRQRLGEHEEGPWVVVLAVHPSVTAVRVPATTQTVSTTPMPTRPDGPRYAAFTVPADQAALGWTLLTATGQAVGTETVRLTPGG